jgi:REP element-mobilizing transposase RayT
MNEAIAYFLTWTTYGTRLHGDERGSADRTHNRYNTPLLAPDPKRRRAEERLLRFPPYKMDPRARAIVEQAIRDHSAHKDWPIISLNVRTNHVHLVVTAARVHPDLVMEQFKSWGTRRLRNAGVTERDRTIWTEHGSTKWLWTHDHVADACTYVEALQ